MSRDRYLVHRDEVSWRVDHNGELVARHTDRAAAVTDACERAKRHQAELVLTDDTGLVEEDLRFGSREPGDGKG